MTTKTSPAAIATTALLLLTMWAAPAYAQKLQPQLVNDGAWAKDVPIARQEQADVLLQRGNEAFLKKSDFTKAAAFYRQSLAIWNHPGTHYNLALALLNLGQEIEAYQHILEAIRYGEAPLGPEKHAHALLHKESIENHLARVEIVSDPPDAMVVMGGKPLPMINGRYQSLVTSGLHTIVATRDDRATRKYELALSPGQTHRLEIRLYRPEELLIHEPRWAKWKPWAVIGAGAALAAGGGVLHLQVRERYRAFDRQVSVCARETPSDGGCRDSALTSQRTRAEKLHTLSASTLTVGGAAAVTGIVFVLLNQSEPRRIDSDTYEKTRGLAVTPMVGGGSTGVLATFSF